MKGTNIKEHFDPQGKLLQHWDRLTEWKEKGQTAPVLVEISPTNFCNAKCPWCFHVSSQYKQAHSKEFMSWETMEKLIPSLKETGVKAVTFTGGGDPSMYPHLDEATKLAKDLGLQVGIFTNGYKTLPYAERFNWIRLTVTEIFKVIEKSAREYSSKTWTGVNFNLTKDNAKHVEKMCQDAKKYGCNYFQVRPALADRYDLQKDVPDVSFVKKYEDDNFKVFLTPYKFEDFKKPHGYPICFGHNFAPFIWHNGDVNVCAYHFGKKEYNLGNLKEHTFKEIWNSERGKKMLKGGVPVIPECQHCCKNHEINKVLYKIKGMKYSEREKDFI